MDEIQHVLRIVNQSWIGIMTPTSLNPGQWMTSFTTDFTWMRCSSSFFFLQFSRKPFSTSKINRFSIYSYLQAGRVNILLRLNKMHKICYKVWKVQVVVSVLCKSFYCSILNKTFDVSRWTYCNSCRGKMKTARSLNEFTLALYESSMGFVLLSVGILLLS